MSVHVWEWACVHLCVHIGIGACVHACLVVVKSLAGPVEEAREVLLLLFLVFDHLLLALLKLHLGSSVCVCVCARCLYMRRAGVPSYRSPSETLDRARSP